MFMSNAGGKLAILAVVPKELQGKIKAKAWSDKVLEACGGKGGGKEPPHTPCGGEVLHFVLGVSPESPDLTPCRTSPPMPVCRTCLALGRIRPISLLRLSLLRFIDSKCLRNSLYGHGNPTP